MGLETDGLNPGKPPIAQIASKTEKSDGF